MSLTKEEAIKKMEDHPMHDLVCSGCGKYFGNMINLEPITQIKPRPNALEGVQSQE